MPVSTANMTEKMGHSERLTNGDTNGDHKSEYVIPRSIPQEPVSILRKPWIAPKGSKLLHPGTITHTMPTLPPSITLLTLFHRHRARQHRAVQRNALRHPRQQLGGKARAPNRPATTLRLL
jgi:hypothetical protein